MKRSFDFGIHFMNFAALFVLTVKSRLVINALVEQLRFFCVPVFQRLNG